MSYEKNHTQEAIKDRGEVFTPEALVEEMLAKLPKAFFTNADKTILDTSAGHGNFLVKTLEWRMKAGISQLEALRTIYGIELDKDNAIECKTRLAKNSVDKKIWQILNHNIVCADALDPKHPGWKSIGYMWEGPSFSSQFFDFS